MAGAMGGAAMLPRGAGGQAYASDGHGHGSAAANTPIPHTPKLTKYVDPLPIPRTAISDPSVYPGADYYDITMRPGTWQFHQELGPAKVWGYWATNPHDPASRSAWATWGRPSA